MKNRELLYRILRPIFSPVFRLCFHPRIVHKEYLPADGAAVVAGNHKHALDPILVDVCTKRIVHTLAKKELHDGRLGFFFRSVGTIPVDLRGGRNMQALTRAVAYLKNGRMINVSPEAGRNRTDALLLPFKSGAVIMAKKAECPIIPYAITGEYTFRSRDLKIVFGEPLHISGLPLREANDALFARVKELLLDSKKQEERECGGIGGPA